MDSRSIVKLASVVLAVLAVGLLLTGMVIALHGASACGTSSNPCDGSDQALDAAQSTYYAIRTLAFGAGATFGVASLLLLGYGERFVTSTER